MTSPNQTEPLLRASGISFERSRRTVLRPLDVQLSAGSVIALVGPNGSGKSTLLSILSGFLSPQSGEIRLGDQGLNQMSNEERVKRLGYLPQQSEAIPPLSVDETLELASVVLKDAYAKRVEEMVRTFDLELFRHRLLMQLSGGERQRVLLALRFLFLSSGEVDGGRVLLLDEPTSGLDLEHVEMMVHQIRIFAAEGNAVFLATHDLHFALRIANGFALLEEGHLLQGLASEVLTPEVFARVFKVSARVEEREGTSTLKLDGPAQSFQFLGTRE